MNDSIPYGYKMTEVGIIPEEWQIYTIAQVFQFLQTGNNSRSELSRDGEYKYVHYGDIHTKWRGFLDCSNNDLPGIDKYKVQHLTLVRDGDLIVADASEDYEGIGASVEIKNVGFQAVVAGLHTLLLRSDELLLAKGFGGYIQELKSWKASLRSIATGISVYGISKSNLKNVVIPLPPLAEQRAIANALSEVDDQIAALDDLIAKKRDLKQGAMQRLLTGEERLPGFSGAWEKIEMGKLGTTYGGLTSKSKADFDNGTVPYIPFLNVMNNAVIDLNYLDYVIISAGENQNLASKGDLFFNTSSETPEEVGMCSVLLDEVTKLYLNSFCFGFRLKGEIQADGLFFAYLFRSAVGRGLMFSLAQGATRYNLSKSNFLKLNVPFPTVQEQIAIASVLSDMDAEISTLEEQREKTVTLKQGMMQELLTGKVRLV